MSAYVPTSPIARTLNQIAVTMAPLPAVQALCRTSTDAATLQRLMPGDGGFMLGMACGWDGVAVKALPPAILIEAQAPEYDQGHGANSWRVTHQVDLFLIHARDTSDSARDSYLRAWDEHNAIQMALMRLPKAVLDVQLVGTSQAPAVFGNAAPPPMQGHYLSTLSLRYSKGQPL